MTPTATLLMRNWIVLSSLFLPTLALAQDAQVVELSPYQLDANDAGVKALIAEDYTGALANFQSSLRLGEANITWLNLGRTYQKMGRCKDAKDAYGKAEMASPVASPTAAEVALVLKNYRGELPDLCPTTVTVMCPSGVAQPSVNGQTTDCAVATEVAPGTVVVTAEGTQPQEIELSEGEAAEITLHLVRVEAPEPLDAPTSQVTTLQLVGLTTAGVGAAALVGALVYDQTVVASAKEDAERPGGDVSAFEDAANFNKILIFGGAGLVVGGAVMYLVGGPADNATAVWVTPTVGGAALGGRF